MPPYQPLGDLLLTFPGQGRAEHYVRELDIDAGVARVTYEQGGARFTREVFAATLKREQDAQTRVVGPDRLVLEGEAIARGDKHQQERKVGVKFCGVARA